MTRESEQPRVVTRTFVRLRRKSESVAAGILRDQHEAQDVVADAFAALWEKGPVDDCAAGPWVLTAVRNRALNRVRDRARSTLADVPEVPVADIHPLDDRVRRLVWDALRRLSERDRAVLHLKFIEEKDGRAIAEALG